MTPTDRMMRSIFLLFLVVLMPQLAPAQSPATDTAIEAYIREWKEVCIRHSHVYGIPASIKLAQAIIESRYGQSELSKEANNHFGIKCHTGWKGKTHFVDDDHPNECFRKYTDPVESFNDHSEFLKNRPRYASLFSIDTRDYKAWAYGLKQAGYATNPQYGDILIRTIEKYQLYQYDQPGYLSEAVSTTEADANLLDAYRSLFEYFAPGPDGRKVYLNNHVQCTFAREGDDLIDIARAFQVGISALMQYNDLHKRGTLKEGQVIYLQKKRPRASQKTHITGNDQTLWEISQVFGIQLNKLLKRNRLPENFEPPAGKILKLR
jgi:hypothetical protein